jgi:hypothetical protein
VQATDWMRAIAELALSKDRGVQRAVATCGRIAAGGADVAAFSKQIAAIGEIVARHVDAIAKECGSIPEGVIKQIEVDAFGRAGCCHGKAAHFLLAEGKR